MKQWSTWRRVAAAIAILCCVAVAGTAAYAGTTGTITGTITDPAGKGLAGVSVAAVSPSQTQKTSTNADGFFVLQELSPDTYTVTLSKTGYQTIQVQGLTVQQDQTANVNQKLSPQLKEIGRVTAASASNLLKTTTGTDVYNISGQQLNVASGGDNLHKTLYEYIGTAPGITTNGFPGLPHIRGGASTDTGYELDGIPIRERMLGFFTTNLSSIGFKNVEVYTGGLSAANAGVGTGIINTVVKTGTYPAQTILSTGLTSPDFNHYLTFEHGGATPNNRFSWYFSFDGVRSQNQYDRGIHTFPNVLYGGFNGPGTVWTNDILANFHYRPTERDDIQFLMQNGLGEFNYNYLLNGPGQRLQLAPCNGNVATPGSPAGFAGGTAPNGATCPAGFYFRALASANSGNIWHHYSGLGKLQWNHLLNDHSNITLRLAENFNQYIFDQPISDPNFPWDPSPAAGCPPFPYAANTPVAVNAKGAICSNEIEVFYGDRRSNMWFGSFDYTTTPNQYTTWKIGFAQEYDNNNQAYYNTFAFNGDGTWPQHGTTAVVPTHFPYVYVDGTFNVGRFTLEPGLRYSEGSYFFPGSKVVSAVSPTFSGVYRAGPNDAFRFSYGDTVNFVGSTYIYRQFSTAFDPNAHPGASYAPQTNTDAEIQWEHQFDRNTSLRIGPYQRSSDNYYALYRPFIGINPANGLPRFGPQTPSNAGHNHVFGAELGLNHVDNRPVGISYFLSGSYENFWTTSVSSLLGSSFSQAQLPATLVAQGIRVRSTDDPPFNGSLALDMHAHQWSLLPLFTYQFGTYYNVGRISNSQISEPEAQASAHWIANTTLQYRLDKAGRSTVGIRVTNLFNNLADTTPCLSDGTGCFPFNGPLSGVKGQPGFIYQDYTQNPRLFEFFFTVKR
jgi:Carboxypeptidase regulatory-like domain